MSRRHAAGALAMFLACAGCGQAQTYEVIDLNYTGNLDKSSSVHLGGAWDLKYAYDCTGRDSTGGFTVEIYNAEDDTLIADNPDTLITHAARGDNKKNLLQHYAHGGDIYFRVISSCNWRIQVRRQGV